MHTHRLIVWRCWSDKRRLLLGKLAVCYFVSDMLSVRYFVSSVLTDRLCGDVFCERKRSKKHTGAGGHAIYPFEQKSKVLTLYQSERPCQ